MLPKMFQQAIPVLEKIERAGYEAYFVGGSVRDYYLNRPINDVDIATSALPEELKKIFRKTVDVGIEHGTILVMDQDSEYEITTFRTESTYKDFRRPDKVEFIRSLNGDLERRDFTMNSMAMNVKGMIIDPYNGKRDIDDRIIRTVGPPKQRFSEDALRMMRGIRFVSQLGFALEESTLKALSENVPLLSHIATERKTMEFEKILSAPFKKEAVSLLIQTGIYKELPELIRYPEALECFTETSNIHQLNKEQAWLLLLSFMAETNVQAFLKKWRLPSKMIKNRSKEIQILKRRESSGWTKSLLYNAGLEAALNVEKVYCCIHNLTFSSLITLEENYDRLPIKSKGEIAVSGKDLMEWAKQKEGPWIKEELNRIESAIINGIIINEKEPIRRWLKECNQQ
ncbi:CCA tRNA nucleotidyltransferase [Rossellomorea aquimaris]|uniref:CCA tRNA nucleotidyltransferase n=1 Tax=Rossellomorea aquimaris TaxID=189382 RepID=UPI0007D08298|nr:CCA tRNA nucleotidyltransferase [Rossellomorea aquimaris]